MDNQETPEQKRIRELELKVHALESNQPILEMTNIKLGYSLRLMSTFHLTSEDKQEIANSIDEAQTIGEVQAIHDSFVKKYNNDSLEEDSDFQWSDSFQKNLRYYFVISLGYDPISKIGGNLQKLANYFSLENKIRSTSDAAVRNPMVEKLMKDRPEAVESMNNAIDVVNSFNDNDET